MLPLSGVTLATGARTHARSTAEGTVDACGSGEAGKLGTGDTRRAVTAPVDVGIRLSDVSSTAQNVAGLRRV